jgi:hypothetical protein
VLGSGVFRNLPPEDIGAQLGQGRSVAAVNGDCEQRIAHFGIPFREWRRP